MSALISHPRQSGYSLRAVLCMTSCLVTMASPAAWAGPIGGAVIAGQASITMAGQSTLIQQNSAKAIINWQQFSLGSSESVSFQQPNGSAIALNRVIGPQASSLQGNLAANGQVWVINPNGVLFGAGSQVNVGGLIATTSDINDQDFLVGTYAFSKASNIAGAKVTNAGKIQTADGGYVVLAGPQVSNAGTVNANLGSVVLGGAKTFAVDFNGDQLLSFAVTGPADQPTQVKNSGSLAADGGLVQLTARAAGAVTSNVVNTDGVVRANSITRKNGHVILDAGDGGGLALDGTVSASGGSITATGGAITVAPTAQLDVSAPTGGGRVAIGSWQSASVSLDAGSQIDASATTKGKGGSVTVIAGESKINGTIIARGGPQGGDGGKVETSGHKLTLGSALVDVGAPLGKAGSWLLDPYDLTIDSTAAGAINTALGNGGDVTLQTTSGSATSSFGGSTNSSGSGDIIVASTIAWTTNQTLTLDAYRNVAVNNGASLSHGANSTLQVIVGDQTGNGTGSAVNGHLLLGATNGSGGTSFTVINTVSELAGINNNLNGNYALGNSLISVGNFSPIGNAYTMPFYGIFEGLGNKIDGLSIVGTDNVSSGTDYVGLFSGTNWVAQIRNLNITNISVSGHYYVAGLAGSNQGIISNVSISGNVTGDWIVGGLVASNANQVSGIASALNQTRDSQKGLAMRFCRHGTDSQRYCRYWGSRAIDRHPR